MLLPVVFRGRVCISASNSASNQDVELDLAPFGRLFTLRCEFSHLLYRPTMRESEVQRLEQTGYALVQAATGRAPPPGPCSDASGGGGRGVMRLGERRGGRRRPARRRILGHDALATLKMYSLAGGSWGHERRTNSHPHAAGSGLNEHGHKQLKAAEGHTSGKPETVRPLGAPALPARRDRRSPGARTQRRWRRSSASTRRWSAS
jgi:hypothetical protein